MDYELFCRSYSQITGLPLSLLHGQTCRYSTIGELLNKQPTVVFPLYPQSVNPGIEFLTPDLEYGRIHIEDTNYDIILGPVFNVPMTEELVHQFMKEQALSTEYKETLTEFFYSMPITSHSGLMQHLFLMYLSLHGKPPEAEEFHSYYMKASENQEQEQVTERTQDLENAHIRNTYTFEISLYEFIKSGNEKGLIEYLNTHTAPLYEGRLASSPLRQAKNMFIGTVQKVGLISAIPGGVEIEKTYQLMDYYIQKCERLQDLRAIGNLQYAMLLDFCRRTGETHIPDGISADIFLCMSYIRTHTNESISLENVAAQINRSVSYVVKKFKKELGINVGAFITRCKLEEAKSLLVFTEQSLAEISSYLCFSSQSYFQNVFKKQYGLTPTQYRKKGRTL